MAEPVGLALAKAHLRIVDDTSEDTLIEAYIGAARAWVEDFTGLILAEREIIESFPSFATPLPLKSWPIEADAVVVLAYTDEAGAPATLDTARLILGARQAKLMPAFDTAWPTTHADAREVSATYQAGYAFQGDVPLPLKQAILLMVGHFYINREAVVTGTIVQDVPLAVETLCRPHRLPVIG